ncbi:sigma-70 family RNA polymerase sigma factor [Pedobacter montanisoli]|uniref:Sigma-70 family RNA polymerase sigma factor n=1 Tax=Pedobacter montanisoli TaxID=2923277 RepID=A0ABS9ZWP4_9SPHI|nr:sigma-70 family RNA polymerase sigma factor [Pedobacter montanisoli]MCJ0742717.1 sigma-70 family RNA polymerase sigma factor [Pedobacter montanisoli]
MKQKSLGNYYETHDLELIEQIVQGKNHLFEVLIRRYNQRLFRIGMSILGEEAEVEDAMQSAYMNAYEHLKRFEKRSSFGTWLTKIMLNQCFQQQKKMKKVVLTGMEHPEKAAYSETPEKVLINKELNKVLEQAIWKLPEKYRLVFVLRELEALSVRETSLTLEIDEPNVKVRLNRAKTMLKDTLGSYMKAHTYQFHLDRCDRIVDGVLMKLGIQKQKM